MSEKFDLGFGNSVCVRKAFLDVYHGDMIVFTHRALMAMDYPERDGDPELIELTKQVIKRQTGEDYKYIVPTNGATGGVVIALRAFRQQGYEYCKTRPAPWYLRYPSMIAAAGMFHTGEELTYPSRSVALVDLPSNPLNLMSRPITIGSRVILDGVYLNRVYTDGCFKAPRHNVMIGSYAKLLGINGIRIGWAATNDNFLYQRMRELAIGEYCGLSVPSAEIIKNTLFNFDWEQFETNARNNLDHNREAWSKLEKYFYDKPVDSKGMFYYAPTDNKCREILEKAGIGWTSGSALGTNDGFGRFNLGQDCELISRAVLAIIRADTI